MVNLIKNENMKIYRRVRTWVMIGLLVLLVGAASFIIWFEDGRHIASGDWRAQLEQQIENDNQFLKESGLADQTKQQVQHQITKAVYQLEHDIKPLEGTMWGAVSNLTGFVMLISLFVVIVAGDTLANEFSTGTIKLLLIRPASRTKILISKYVACVLFGILLLFVLFIVSFLANGALYGFGGWTDPYLKVDDAGTVLEKSMILYVWSDYLFSAVSAIMYVTISFMISAVFRSSAMAIGISIFTMFVASELLTVLLYRYEWSKFLLFPNMNLKVYLEGIPYKEGMTMGFSISVLLVYFVVINLLTWLVFTKRDVAT